MTKDLEPVEKALRKLAKQWRQNLKDPLILRKIKAGKITLTPLISDILRKFK